MFKKNKKENLEGGYILAFALILTSILLAISFSTSRIISSEILFSRITENNKIAYLAANQGLDCAQYLNSYFKISPDNSIILDSVNLGGKVDFENNANNKIFIPTNPFVNLNMKSYEDIYCASDGTYNKMFSVYSNSVQEVIDNMNNSISSFNIIGDSDNATTTFSLILKENPLSNNSIERCVLVSFVKNKSNILGKKDSYNITSTGYSSCNSYDKSKVSRTIYKYYNY